MSKRLTDDEVNAIMALAGQLATKRAVRARLCSDPEVTAQRAAAARDSVHEAGIRLRSYLENLT